MPKIGVPKFDSMLRVARDIFWEGEGLCLPLPRKYVTRPLYVSLFFYKYGNMMCLFIKYLSS